MSIQAAKKAIAALLLNQPTTSHGAVSVDALFSGLCTEGHHRSDLEAALFELRTDELICLDERVEWSVPGGSVWADAPEGVFLVPVPKPEPTEYRYRVVWPLEALEHWWKRQREAPANPATL